MTKRENHRCGFVGIVGPTNSGKSTLLNRLIDKKISIVSPLPQTTYHRVRGILNTDAAQIIFTDTPGYQHRKEGFAQCLNTVADKNAQDCDVLLWTFDVSRENVAQQIFRMKRKISSLKSAENSLCLLNKIDRIAKPALLPLLASISELSLFSEIVPLSARTGCGIDSVIKSVVSRLPAGAPLYPRECSTDRPQDFLISEFIREKVYLETQQELPYSVWIETEEWKTDDHSRCPTIRAVVHVDSESRKAILIGKGGSKLREIGIRAREEIEKLLGRQICLKLHVDVHSEWRRDRRHTSQYLELGA